MSSSKDGVEEAFTRLDEERLLEIAYLIGGGRTFRGDRQNFLSFLNILRKDGESGFCDVVLVVDGQSFPAHRCVLAANSQFFYTLFTSGMRDSNEKHVKLCSLSSSALCTILNFFYTREIAVNKDNAEELLEAASFLLLNHVKNACAAIIASSLSISNCFSTKRLADRYALDELKRKSDSFLKDNFQAAKQQNEFLELDPYELKEVISSDSVRVEKEEEVFEAIRNWVKHDPANRAKELSLLLPCLRYGSLSPEFLEEQFEKDPIFENNSFCQNFLKQQRRRRRSARSKKQPSSKERPSARIHDVVIGVGRGNLRTSFCYDVQSEQVFKLPDPPSPFFQLGVAAIGKELFTVCRNRHDWDNNATKLMKHTLGSTTGLDHSWSKIDESLLKPNVCFERSVLVSLQNKLYVLGGCVDSINRSVDIQCYDPTQGNWIAMANMNTSRCSIGAVATCNYIFALGGKKGHSSLAEKVVERYDPELNEWATMAEMFYARVSPHVVTTSSGIFVLGGFTGLEESYFCEVYKESSSKWSLIAPLPNKIPKITLSLNDEVYVVSGGKSWKYSRKKGLWKKSPVFKALQNGFDDYNFVHLKLPKFCYEQYYRIAVHRIVRFNRNFYDCSSDDDDEDDYHDPLFFWGDDSSESEW